MYLCPMHASDPGVCSLSLKGRKKETNKQRKKERKRGRKEELCWSFLAACMNKRPQGHLTTSARSDPYPGFPNY
eukprot:1157873-Pelagomonas_calceolata.AAC.3